MSATAYLNDKMSPEKCGEIASRKWKEEESPYLSIREFCKKYSTWSESSIRWLIYNNTANFNERVVRRIGKTKILLSVTAMWQWCENQDSQVIN